MHRSLFVLSGVNPLRGYGPVIYLADALVAAGIDVELFAPVPRRMMKEFEGHRFRVHSYFMDWYGSIPRLRLYLFGLYLLYRGSRERPAILCSDIHFFREAVFLRRRFPEIPLIHFCEELFLPEEKKLFPMIRHISFYERNANAPDLVVDVEPHRAAIRKARYGLTSDVVVLQNTIPRSEMPIPDRSGSLSRLAGGSIPPDRPVLVYTGGVHSKESFLTIISALSELKPPVFFLGFCHGHASHVRWLKELVQSRLGPERGRICPAVQRNALLSCLGEANAGLVYYPYSVHPTQNQLYCSPTKAMEYLACGLPVVGSANPSLIGLLEAQGRGVCTRDDSAAALRDAIITVLNMSRTEPSLGERLRKDFRDNLCFEVQSTKAMGRILEILKEARPIG